MTATPVTPAFNPFADPAHLTIDHVQNTLTGFMIDKNSQLKYLKETPINVLMHSDFEKGTIPDIPIRTLNFRAEIQQTLDPIEVKDYLIKAFTLPQNNEVTTFDESEAASYYKFSFKADQNHASVGGNTCNTGYNSGVEVAQVVIQSLGQTGTDVKSENQKEIIEWLDSFETNHSFLN